jgi:predicted tellurium resistance membrane protein TerC
VLELPYLRLIGGALLLYIAIKLLIQDEADEDSVESSDNLWGAIKTVAIADVVMSLDNVLAIAAAAKGHPWLIAFGLLVSIPLIVAGATLIMSLLHRFPILVWAGAGLLGWIAGELLMEDPTSRPHLDGIGAGYGLDHHATEITLQVACVLFVLCVGWLLMKWQSRGRKQVSAQNSAAE